MTDLLHHTSDGPSDAPALLLGPSLGTSLAVWDAQVPALARHFRVIRWDLPGHGGSPAGLLAGPGPGATVADLARLVLDLADHLGLDRFAHAGISLGGAVGAHLAVHHPDRISALALVCTSARFGEPQPWHDRAALVRDQGTGPLVATAHARWFTPDWTGPAAVALVADQGAADPAAYAACCEALAAFDLRRDLHRITAPTLVVAGRQDTATPPEHARALADGIPDAALVEIPSAAHLAPVEQPGAVLAALRSHLRPLTPAPAAASAPAPTQVPTPFRSADADADVGHGPAPGTDAERHAAGTAVRRAVLGDAHVDRAVARSTELTAPFQDFITRYAWGEIWTRPGLDRRTRSCITLTALVAGGHHDELALHLRAALRNGLTPDEIGEVLLQSAVYCGVPAANTAFAIAARILHDDKDDH